MKILDFDIALDKSTKRFTIEKNKKAYYFQSSIEQLLIMYKHIASPRLLKKI